jgi:DNA-binding response OmpR family regulator
VSSVRSTASGRRRPRVLFVEDEAMVRVLGVKALTGAGFDVDEAPDGVAAVALLADPKNAYDVVFMDLGIPGIRGEDVIVRVQESCPAAKVVVVTGEPVNKDKLPPGVTLLAKPFAPKHLVTLAKRFVAKPKTI